MRLCKKLYLIMLFYISAANKYNFSFYHGIFVLDPDLYLLIRVPDPHHCRERERTDADFFLLMIPILCHPAVVVVVMSSSGAPALSPDQLEKLRRTMELLTLQQRSKGRVLTYSYLYKVPYLLPLT